MDISAYTSNIQPYGSFSGTKFASEDVDKIGIKTNNDAAPLRRDEELETKKTESMLEAAREREKVSEEERQKMVEEMNEFISSINKGLSFRLDEESGKQVITIYEVGSGEIIRQFPDADMLKVYQNLATNHSGILVDRV